MRGDLSLTKDMMGNLMAMVPLPLASASLAGIRLYRYLRQSVRAGAVRSSGSCNLPELQRPLHLLAPAPDNNTRSERPAQPLMISTPVTIE